MRRPINLPWLGLIASCRLFVAVTDWLTVARALRWHLVKVCTNHTQKEEPHKPCSAPCSNSAATAQA